MREVNLSDEYNTLKLSWMTAQESGSGCEGYPYCAADIAAGDEPAVRNSSNESGKVNAVKIPAGLILTCRYDFFYSVCSVLSGSYSRISPG